MEMLAFHPSVDLMNTELLKKDCLRIHDTLRAHVLPTTPALSQEVKLCFSQHSPWARHCPRQEGHKRRASASPKKLLSFHEALLISEKLHEKTRSCQNKVNHRNRPMCNKVRTADTFKQMNGSLYGLTFVVVLAPLHSEVKAVAFSWINT